MPAAMCVENALLLVVLHLGIARTWAEVPFVGIRTDISTGGEGTGYQIPSHSVDGAEKICRAEACTARAAVMLQAINTTVDPCENFFEYSCGNWITVHPVPASESHWGTFNQMENQLNTKLEDLMQQNTNETSSARRKARQVYAACMNLSRIEREGIKPFISAMKKIIGSWPILNKSWTSTEFDVLKMYGKFGKAGQSYLQAISGGPNVNDPRKNILTIDEMSLGLSNKMYYEPSMENIRQAYLVLMKNLTTLLSKDLKVPLPTNLDQQLQEILDFEKSIANISYTKEQRRNPDNIYHLMTLNDFLDKHFNKTFKKSDFVALLRSIPQNKSVADAIQLNMTINVVNPVYHERLDEIWFQRLNGPDKEKTGKRFIANYLGWRMLYDAASDLSKAYRDAVFEYKKVTTGVTEQDSRATTCARYANNAMPLAIGSMYVEKYFGADSKAMMGTGSSHVMPDGHGNGISGEVMTNRDIGDGLLPVVDDIKTAFRTIITEASWMDDETRGRALKKLEKMTDYIAYPDFLISDFPRLDKLYGKYQTTEVHYENSQTIEMQQTAESLELILKPNARNLDETATPAEVNAFYEPDLNMIALFAGIAQPPFFHKDYPPHLNYAAVGSVFGHEITHGFDDQGSLYDEEGRLFAWWTNASTANFKERAQTIIDQYSAFETVTGNINGPLTAGENIADNGGIKEAHLAFKQYLARQNGTAPLRLPGLDRYSQEQVFFLAGAQIWCNYDRLEYLKNKVLLDVHSPNQFRVNGPMSNLPEFAEAYNCSLGSGMNPIKRAGVW